LYYIIGIVNAHYKKRVCLFYHSSSSNAKKWEIELQTLKNNNARLTAALQESTANVDEWKKQLAGYKDETGRMKKKVRTNTIHADEIEYSAVPS